MDADLISSIGGKEAPLWDHGVVEADPRVAELMPIVSSLYYLFIPLAKI
jgi:hypothetical protein